MPPHRHPRGRADCRATSPLRSAAEAPVTGRTRLKSAIRQCAWRGRGACALRSILRCRPCRRSSFRRRDRSATGRPPRGTASAAARRSPVPDLLHGREISRAASRTQVQSPAARMRPSGRATRPRRKMRRCFAVCAADSGRPLPRRGSPQRFPRPARGKCPPM